MYFTTGIDNLSGAWLPNTHYLYGENLPTFNLDDTRTIAIQMRMMMTINDIHPNCYMVSKVLDMVPKGVLKLSLKQDEYDEKRDNIQLKVCDYYNDTGDIIVQEPEGSNDPCKTSEIYHMMVNKNGELEQDFMISTLTIAETTYWHAVFSDQGVSAQWRIKLVDEATEKERLELERLMVIRDVDSTTISLRPGKSNRLKGKHFKLIACDVNGDYESIINLEVAE